MALGICTPIVAAVFAAFLGITEPPPGLFIMIVMVVTLTLIVAMVAARVFAQQA